MFPSFELFGRTVGTYGLCTVAGLLLMLLCVWLLARRRGYDPDDEVIVCLVSFIGVAVGASLLYGVTNIGYLRDFFERWVQGGYGSFADFLGDVALCFGGFVYYGGLIGGVALGAALVRRRGWDVCGHLDVFAVAIPLFHAFGRIGCFLGGCCYGVEADWGFVYTEAPIAEANGVMRVPVQLVEAACEFVLFAVLLALFRADRMHGRLIAVYGICYGAVRFVDEFWRGDAYRGFLGPLSTSQWISVAVVVSSVVFLIVMHRRRAARCGGPVQV